MQPTRRAAATAGVAVALATLGVVLDSVLYLYGAVGVGAWVVVEAVAFARTVVAAVEATDVAHAVAPETTREGQPVEGTVALSAPDAIRGLTGVELRPPLAASRVDGDDRLAVDDAGSSHRLAATFEFPVTGRFAFDPPVLALSSEHGLFVETAAVGERATCTVEPNAPTDVAVGEGGNRISLGVGEHDAQLGGSGFTPGDLREYAVGDPQNLIDWKATARQGEPYVREFESAGELETVLFVDHRGATGVGPDGRRALDYLRSVGRWLVEYANARDDPVGLYAIGDDGPTARVDPSSRAASYRRVATALRDLEPTSAPDSDASTGTDPPVRGSLDAGVGGRSPGAALATPGELDGDTAFERTLSAYREGGRGYVERVAEDPLFRVVEATLSRTRTTPWVVVLTTDDRPTEVAETVRAARGRAAHVTAFVAPTALFESGSLADLDVAYERYEAFERFRGGLVREDVDAFEVAPGERLDAVLSRAGSNRGGRR